MADRSSSEFLRRLERVGAEIDPGLSERDVERLVAGARRLAKRRAARRVVAGLVVGVVAAVATTGLVWRGGGATRAPVTSRAAVPIAGPPSTTMTSRTVVHGAAQAPGPVRTVEPAGGRPLHFPDGSVAVPLDDATELTVRESSERRIAIDLERGRGRFEVTPRAERTFSVRAGDVKVSVLGTIFMVERVADRIGVRVERGRVLVDWGSGSVRLGAGERGWFPPLQVGASRAGGSTARPRAGASRLTGPSDGAVDGPAKPVVGSLATKPSGAEQGVAAESGVLPAPPSGASRVGLAPGAEVAPTAGPAATVSSPQPQGRGRTLDDDSVESLLAAADLARVDGRASDATALLRRALERHRADRRAPLAAFTLGRMLLVELGQPREAAAAFAQARVLAPDGPLAEDALAREVEAWSKANEGGQARERAEEYLRRYPTGRRVQAVRVFGGVE